jgi:hypothetical protein
MFIPQARSVPHRPVPVAIIAIVVTGILLALLMLALFVWCTRRAARTDREAHPAAAEKPVPPAAAPAPRTALRPLELAPVPRAYTPFSSLPPRWSARFALPPAPAVYSDADEKTILPLYSARPAPVTAPISPGPPRRYSSRAARREREGGVQGFKQSDWEGQERGRVMGKLNGLIATMRVEFKDGGAV